MADYAGLVANLERCAERARQGPLARMVIPVGPPGAQSLNLIYKQAKGVMERELGAVSFVPLLSGRA